MKKLITILLCITCISVNAVAQSGVRIGNLEISVRKSTHDPDTMVQIIVTDPPTPSENENKTKTKPKTNHYKYNETSSFIGWGFILPDNGSDYYTTLGGNSINIDIGWMGRYQIARRFALGSTLQYSYYNYKLRDAASEPMFMEEILGRTFVGDNIKKQVFRSHNIAAGAFTRFYLIPPPQRVRDGGVYIDLGVQGDFAFSKYYKLKTYHPRAKEKRRNGYAFNPFTASATARVGWNEYAIFARYRFTDAFNSKALPMDIPPITIGIQFVDLDF